MSREQEVKTHQPRRRGPMGHGMQPGEKPKDFKKSIKKLMSYIGKYKAAIFVVMFFAACSTIFNVAGPKILGKATTALSEGLMAKIQGTGSIDFGDGTAATNFTVAENADQSAKSPKTGEDFSMALCTALLMVSCAGLAGIFAKRKRNHAR